MQEGVSYRPAKTIKPPVDVQQLHAEQIAKLNEVTALLKQVAGVLNGSITIKQAVADIKSVETPDVDKVVRAVESLNKTVLAKKWDTSGIERSLKAIERKETPKFELEAQSIELAPLGRAIAQVVKAVQEQKYPDPTPPTDVKGIESRLDTANEKLERLVRKPVGGGGGGGGYAAFLTSGGASTAARLNDDGSLPTTSTNMLVTKPYDSITGSYPNATTEVYTYKLGSTTVATVTVIYTSSTKDAITSVTRV